MGVQARQNIDNRAFYLSGNANAREAETLAQDGARAAVLATKTVMAKNPTTGYWVPLTEVDPDAAPAKMVTGAIGLEAVFQAVSDGSFGITVDGTAIALTGLDFSGIEAPTATGATMTTGALGATLDTMQAITDGSFGITVDGVSVPLTGLNFSDISAPADAAAKCVCGANGTNLAGWAAVANGGFGITVDGTLYTFTDVDFTGVAALGEVAVRLNGAVGGAGVEVKYNAGTDVFEFYSKSVGEQSTITAVVTGGTTDISGAGFLNGLTGVSTLTQGVGGDGFGTTIMSVINTAAAGRFRVEWNSVTTLFVFLSPRRGAISTIAALVAGGAGTDISGAGHLNGLTGTAVLVQGTGDTGDDRNIADVLNEAAEGRFVCEFDGSAITFLSPTTGGPSAVTVLIAGVGGTDVSGASYLNGLTGVGTATASTGFFGVNIPAGIYIGDEIAAATLVAGIVPNSPILVGGNVTVDREQIVLEGSLALTDEVVAARKTIEDVLATIGIFTESTVEITGYENT